MYWTEKGEQFYSFRKYKSLNSLILVVTKKISANMKKNKRVFFSALMDLKKAFDRVDLEALWHL